MNIPNNWIPLDQKKPKEGDVIIVTIIDSIRRSRELRYPVYYMQSNYCTEYGFYQYGNQEFQLLPEFSKVVAWMPMPIPWEGDSE